MNIPELHGSLNHNNFFVYAACDNAYFEEFGKFLINSVKKNTSNYIHIHIFNPTDDNLTFCRKNNVSLSYEYVPIELFANSANRWRTVSPEDVNYQRTLNAMKKGNDKNIIDRMQKTYYACARFIRLRQMLKSPSKFLAIDVDAVVRSNIPEFSNNKDFYIHQITGPKARFLAGGIYSLGTAESLNFLNEYADMLTRYIEEDQLYWSVDQDVLDKIVPKYNFEHLPKNLIDWDMTSDGIIWTAKGTRKNNDRFVSEKLKYKS